MSRWELNVEGQERNVAARECYGTKARLSRPVLTDTPDVPAAARAWLVQKERNILHRWHSPNAVFESGEKIEGERADCLRSSVLKNEELLADKGLRIEGV